MAVRIPEITPEARLYAIRELARRAGVAGDFFRSWRIDVQSDWSTIYFEPGTSKRLRFRNAFSDHPEQIPNRAFQVAHRAWVHPPREALRRLIPDFVVPFSVGDRDHTQPIFHRVDPSCLECDLDLPLACLLTLSRFEETLIAEKDIHDRIPASKTLAFREAFLARPIVDELGLALEQAMSCLIPNWQPAPRNLRVKLSHDIDLVGIPFSLRTAIGHTIRRHKPTATMRDLFSRFGLADPTYLELVHRVVQLSLDRGLNSAVYWQASTPGTYDTGYDPRHPRILRVISSLSERGVECGVHPGYETFRCRDRLFSEVQILHTAIGKQQLGGRQHYLRWSPDTWLDWEACGLAYDSSVGFADQVGFRAGTCFPYRPWILAENREAKLLEIPLIVMDCTPMQYMGLSSERSLEVVRECVERCRAVGGVFTLLWHNSTLIEPAYGQLYPSILDGLAGSSAFDWKTALYE